MNSLLRISNTGALSGGTGTDDSQPLSSLIFSHPGAVSNVGLAAAPIFAQVGGNHSGAPLGVNGGGGGYSTYFHPLVLAQNEGFRLRNDHNPFGGTDSWVAYVAVDWFEASSF